jgi:hypothetical protein
MQTPLGTSHLHQEPQPRPLLVLLRTMQQIHHNNPQGASMIDSKTKRITLKVSKDIDLIRDRLAADTGIEMTYNQIFNFLVHFYVERASEPKSKWKSLS